MFDQSWYLSNNPDVVLANVNPILHFLQYGGLEGRDPGPNFSSKWYLDTYEDVKVAGINPLIHYLRYGWKEGRMTRPLQMNQLTQFHQIEFSESQYRCPICQNQVNEFLPLSTLYIETLEKFGFPYSLDECETINREQYICPYCGASDRDRLYACYLDEKLSQYNADDKVLLLDIAPSQVLSHFIEKFKHVNHRTADLLVEGTDIVVDITNMPEIESDSYDILICSHVLEHVSDDKRALAELYRVLKPGGWGIIMVPIILTAAQIDEDPEVLDVAERWRRFGQDDHVRLYNKSGFIDRVESAGFTLHQLGVDYFDEPVFKQYGITRQSVLYVVEKNKTNVSNTYVRRKCDFFFIIGTGRSGTTLMAQVMNAHSQICVPAELQIAFEVSNNGARLAEIFETKKNLRFQAADYIKLIQDRCPHNLSDYYDYHAFFNRLHYPIRSLQWLLTELYTDIAYSQGKSIFAEQTPWYGQNIKLLSQLFPHAKFVHMIRDGRDVAISFTRTPWWHKDVNLNLERWAREVNKTEEDASLLLKQNMLTIRYEDFVSTPERVIKKVCDFLNLTFEKTMLDLEFHTDYSQLEKHDIDSVSSPVYQEWKKKKKSAFFSESVYGWKTNKDVDFSNISRPVARLLERFGYDNESTLSLNESNALQDGDGKGTPPASLYDAIFARFAESATLKAIWNGVYAEEYPNEVGSPYSFVTVTELKLIVASLPIGSSNRFVDIACGQGDISLWVARQTGGSVVGVDYSKVAIQSAILSAKNQGYQDRTLFVQGDASNTNIASASLDGAISIDSLQVMPDPFSVIVEVARILKTGAVFAFTAWEINKPPVSGRSIIPDYRPLLKKAGFEIERYDEPEGWRQQQEAVYRKIQESADILKYELGNEASSILLEDAARKPHQLVDFRRVLVIARKYVRN